MCKQVSGKKILVKKKRIVSSEKKVNQFYTFIEPEEPRHDDAVAPVIICVIFFTKVVEFVAVLNVYMLVPLTVLAKKKKIPLAIVNAEFVIELLVKFNGY